MQSILNFIGEHPFMTILGFFATIAIASLFSSTTESTDDENTDTEEAEGEYIICSVPGLSPITYTPGFYDDYDAVNYDGMIEVSFPDGDCAYLPKNFTVIVPKSQYVINLNQLEETETANTAN